MSADAPQPGSVLRGTTPGAPRLDSETWDSTKSKGSRFPLPACAILLLTGVLSLTWSHHKLLNQDEMFVLQTDTVSSVRQLIHIQHTTPISLDPLVFHLLAHASTRLCGPSALALRLPSLAGFLLMQVCLFLFVRRATRDHPASDRAALFAMAFPALTATLFYSAEARPYGLLLGLYALTLLAYQSASRHPKALALGFTGSQKEQGALAPGATRTSALITLTLAITLTLNSHYFGILLLIPLCAAEIFRTLQRRRLDLPLLAAIILGMASIVFALPFQKPAAEFRKHYYNAGAVTLHAITQAYRALLVDYTRASLSLQYIAAIAFVLGALALIAAVAFRFKSKTFPLTAPETVFVLTLAALPFFGFLLARFVTHSIEVRYVLGALIAITSLLAIALAPVLTKPRSDAPLTALLLLALAATGAARIHTEAAATRETIASLTPTPELIAALVANPDHALYMQDMGHFEVAQYYIPNPLVRSRLTLVYSSDREIQYDHHDTEALTALHLQQFSRLHIVPYETLVQRPGSHIFVLFHSGWDWTDQAFAADAATLTPIGPALTGDAVSVRFR